MDKSIYTVAVLMSTYNGERFLEEQIDSILNQEEVHVKLIVRDDGSSDSTVDILNNYGRNVTWYRGENKGSARSFMELLYNAESADFYAFSDQDDIWYPKKLIRAIRMINNYPDDKCVLYASNQNMIDKKGNNIGIRFTNDKANADFFDIFFNSDISGCTMVLNKKLRETLSKIENRPDDRVFKYVMHDVWINISSRCLGTFIYDSEPSMDFRRHDSNVTTATKYNFKDKMIHAFRFLVSGKKCTYKIWAQEIIKIYGSNIVEENVGHLEKLANYDGSFESKRILLHDKTLIKNFTYSRIFYYMVVILGRIE
ncbi:MAG: glycosyltransferase family 2 protein [Clostridiales bacterium]|nr:glycosyltransferase family 2 protein [Clostridiales bacterium]